MFLISEKNLGIRVMQMGAKKNRIGSKKKKKKCRVLWRCTTPCSWKCKVKMNEKLNGKIW